MSSSNTSYRALSPYNVTLICPYFMCISVGNFPVQIDTSTLSAGTHSVGFTATGTLSDGSSVTASQTFDIQSGVFSQKLYP